MSRLMGVCLLTAVLAASAGCRRDRGPSDVWVGGQGVSPDALAQAGLAYYWKTPVGLNEDETITRLWHLDENVYCLTSENRIIAYDAAIGTRRWTAELAEQGAPVFPPCHAQNVLLPPRPGPHIAVNPVPASEMKSHDIVIFNTVSHAVMLDRTDGQELHRIDFAPAGITANTGTVTDGSLLYVASVNGMYAGIDLITGLSRGKAGTGAMISANPVMHGRQLFFASRSGAIECLLAGFPLRQLWARTLPGNLNSDFAVDDRGMFIGCQDYNVYALDPVSGERSWEFSGQGAISRPTQVGKTNVYANADGDKFYAISIVNGSQKWALPDQLTVVAEIGNDVLAVNDRPRLLLVDGESGQVKNEVPMTGLSIFVPNTQTQAIYAASPEGRLCCLRPVAAGYVTPEMLRTQTTQPTTAP